MHLKNLKLWGHSNNWFFIIFIFCRFVLVTFPFSILFFFSEWGWKQWLRFITSLYCSFLMIPDVRSWRGNPSISLKSRFKKPWAWSLSAGRISPLVSASVKSLLSGVVNSRALNLIRKKKPAVTPASFFLLAKTLMSENQDCDKKRKKAFHKLIRSRFCADVVIPERTNDQMTPRIISGVFHAIGRSGGGKKEGGENEGGGWGEVAGEKKKRVINNQFKAREGESGCVEGIAMFSPMWGVNDERASEVLGISLRG